jgi:hypothetical protein
MGQSSTGDVVSIALGGGAAKPLPIRVPRGRRCTVHVLRVEVLRRGPAANKQRSLSAPHGRKGLSCIGDFHSPWNLRSETRV